MTPAHMQGGNSIDDNNSASNRETHLYVCDIRSLVLIAVPIILLITKVK